MNGIFALSSLLYTKIDYNERKTCVTMRCSQLHISICANDYTDITKVEEKVLNFVATDN